MRNLFNLSKSLLVAACAALSLALVGCGGDSGGASTGPSSGDAFAGTSISFNPTVNFSAGGNLTYFNNEAGSPFPASDPAADGTYTYVPNATFTGGTLALTVDGIQSAIVLEISNFTRTGPNVTGFTANSGGQSYPVTVTGTLVAYQRPGGGGGGGGGGGNAGLVDATGDIPSQTRGTFSMTFFNAFGEPTTVPGSPYDADDVVEFTIGANTLAFGGKTLTNPKNPSSSLSDFVFQDGDVWYWVYGNRTPIQINVYGGANPTQAGTTFFGGFTNEDDEDTGGGGDTSTLAGTYSGIGNHVPTGTTLPDGVPANGATITFTISNDLQTLVFNGRTLPLSGDSRPTSLSYTDAQTSPSNNAAVILYLNNEGSVSHFAAQYLQTITGIPPEVRTLTINAVNDSVTKN
jgi:hypothetical protein